MRELLKSVLLASINAEDKDSARKAVQREINFNPEEFGWVRNEDLNLSDIIDTFANKHSPIRNYFFSGSGIWLQNIDSIIAEKVINHFTQEGVAVLCIHDSFIITADKLMQLQIIMDEAFVEVLRKLGIDYNHEPKTSLKGGSKEQWGFIIGHPELTPASDSYLKNIKYDHPEWYERLESFKQRKLEDYYVPEADLKNWN